MPPRPPAPRGNLHALQREFREAGIGPLLIAEVRYMAHQLAPRYNAAVYSDTGNWRDGLDDLAQDILANSLLRDRQASYMLEVAATIDDFRRLLARQVRRCLARRRTRTVIDNILDRARPVLMAPPFEQRRRHQYPTFCLAGTVVEDRAATFGELRAAAQVVRRVPQVRPRGDRAPLVFTTPSLRAALEGVAEVLPVAFTVGELDRVLRLALPHFLPGVLDPDQDVQGHEHVDGASVVSAAQRLQELLDRSQRLVLGMKIEGASDSEIAPVLGVSRRTVTNWKAVAYEAVEELLGPLTHTERLAVLDRVGAALQDALIQKPLSI